jgi:phosphoglycerate dehydrogenase-like enzyme
MEVSKIAVLMWKMVPFQFTEVHMANIKKVHPTVEIILAQDEDELLAKTADADVLYTFGALKPERFCLGAQSLKWIHSFITGVDQLLDSKIAELDIKISCSKGIAAEAISDHALSFICSFIRRLPAHFQKQRKHEWYLHNFANPEIPIEDEIAGKKVGIIGMGFIGKAVARKCKLLGKKRGY